MPPVLGIIGGIITAIGAPALGGAIVGLGGAGAIGGFVAGWGAAAAIGGFFGTTIGGLIGSAGLSLGASYLSSLLRPKAAGGSFQQSAAVSPPSDRLVNLRQAIPVRTRSYGRVRVGGPVYFWKAKDGKRFYGIVLNSGEIHQFVGRYLDERFVTIDGSGFVTTTEYQSGGRSRVQLQEFRGNSAQAAPTLLTGNFTEWTTAHKVTGCAHAVIAAENCPTEDFSTVYPGGREPTYTAVIDATKCYDPREEDHDPDDATTWEFTRNAALIMAHWVTNDDGLGRQVDWDIVAEEADACDVLVTNRDDETQPKWELCGTYSFGEDRESVRAQMAVGCDSFFFETITGKVGFRVGRWIAPTVTISAGHILSINITEGQDGTDVKNAFAVQYAEPASGYREEQAAAYVIDDGNPYEEDTISAFWIPSHNQAVRVGKRLLLGARSQYRISARLKLQGLRLIGQRFFTLDFSEADIVHAFEVDKLTFSDDGLSLELEAHSVLESDFNFNAATEESAQSQRTEIEEELDVPEPTTITAQATAIPIAGGTAVAILVDFDDPPRDSYVHQIRYRVESPVGDWFTVDIPQGQSYQYTPALSDGETYEVQVRARAQTGRASDWAPVTPLSITATADATPPGVATGVSGTGGSGTADVDWTAPNSANYVAARIYRRTTNTFIGSTLVHTEYGAPNTADTWTDSALSAGTYYYWVVAVNGSGVAASEVATGAVVVS